MKFDVETWPVQRLIDLHEGGGLNLNPPYQRNDIWLKKMKQKLIDSIMHNYPMPAFFLHKTGEMQYDMVDGQQRTRAILGYFKGIFPDLEGLLVDGDRRRTLFEYQLVMIIITEIGPGELIHDFYDRVNSLGLHLKRGETLKAKYRGTKFLALVSAIAENELLQDLQLFSDRALERLDDIDFISELVALLEYGITEKKKQPEEMFTHDITEEKSTFLLDLFLTQLRRIKVLNDISKLSDTRYYQRNDFYTLFHFISTNPTITDEQLGKMYKLMVKIGSHISPSNERCPVLQDYAFDCVSQSNSGDARRRRYEFFEKILLNTNETANDEQRQILDYFQSTDEPLIRVGQYNIINYDALGTPEGNLGGA